MKSITQFIKENINESHSNLNIEDVILDEIEDLPSILGVTKIVD